MTETNDRKWGLIPALFALSILIGCGSADPGIEIPGDKPFAPTALIAQADNATKVVLSWSDNSQIEESYRIERKKGSDADFEEIKVTAVDAEEFQDSTIQANESYTYRVRAANQKGFSDFSNEKQVDIPDGLPHPPSNLTAEAGANTFAFVALSWEDNATNETHFVVKRGLGEDTPLSEYVAISTEEELGPDSKTFQDNSVGYNQTYCYFVEAVNSYGSALSDVACDTTPQAIGH